MKKLNLLDEHEVQHAYAQYIRLRRKQLKLSREALEERSTVPMATLKKFELTGQISFRQLLLLWQSVDDLQRLYSLTLQHSPSIQLPTTIEEVLNNDF